MRTHGDLHLGQVLVAQNDAYLIDFEGEPARPLSERRAKTSPLRDVAGMLRSFDYAAAMAAQDGAAPAVPDEAARARTREIAARYRQVSEQAFTEAYRAAAAPIAHRWQDPQAEDALIDLFTLEKAAYEIAYEAANRPSWLGVPLRGLGAIVARLLDPENPHG
jgi:maltose alpha-D-glucosyltransferase/alpha-amylase